MSVEALTQFGQKVAQEPALQAEAQETLGISLSELMSMNAEQIQSANTEYPDLVVDLAAKYGYHFTKKELLEQITVVMNPNAQGELSDEALEAVAGGAAKNGVPGLPTSGSQPTAIPIGPAVAGMTAAPKVPTSNSGW
ncbi:Nif11-like leader peptide family natural product precursor [Iningainema tapete]|uniref:Nif11-like leader peptide family natural product n=1 Tax=Iningainema tapete BLCC-T55 TaxID=2748662 RepID=A0A8J6XDN4_9CYAN|nr:Nif11-like leader peptide family natural product precursor [Iningainema tapete]MBD2774170.1 Nif11-like leader peptide family natural product precursor [Iningainema tapete BLCC-T55]